MSGVVRPVTRKPVVGLATYTPWHLSDLPGRPTNGLRVVSTFGGGGGSSMGYKLAGYTMVGANDIDPEMAWHYQRNLAPQHYMLCPIRDLLTATLPPSWEQLDVLDGSPPCSTFSIMATRREQKWGVKSHFREGQASQVLSDLFFDYLDLAERLRPKVLIAENVTGMLKGRAVGYTKLVLERMKAIGYRPQLFQLNAADCGVPQRRERVFFCALRDDLTAPPLTLTPARPWVACVDALDGLVIDDDDRAAAAPTPLMTTWWPKTRPGESFAHAQQREWGGTRSNFSWIVVDPRRPCYTLIGNTRVLLHWTENRSLTYAEFKRFGAFPEDYFAKTPVFGKYVIGMSVPPFLTAYVARCVARQWLGTDIPDDALSARYWSEPHQR